MRTRRWDPGQKLRINRLRWLAIAVVALIGSAGYFGPWVPHKAAGLVVVGLDLAEYVKFLPEVASRQIILQRELFYLPLLAESIGATLLASRRALPGWIRVGLALAGVPLALAMLPPAWSPAVLSLPEFRLQVAAIGGCLLLTSCIYLLQYLPDRLVLILLALLTLAAAVAPAWGFLQVRPAIAGVYGHPLALGWGFWANTAGFLGVTLIAIAETIRR